MRPLQHLVVAGNGRTAIGCLEEFLLPPRQYDITVFGVERYCAYDRAGLPSYLAGECTLEALFLRGLDWYQDRGVSVHFGTGVLDVNVESKTLVAEDGLELSFDKLLLATGSVPVLPPIPGLENSGICTIATLDDAKRVASLSKPGRLAVVIGDTAYASGLAAALTVRGCVVTRVATAQAILGDGAVSGVAGPGNETIPAHFVVIACGTHPNIRLAVRAGLDVATGILVDNRRRTSDPSILAAGSCAQLREELRGGDGTLRHVQTGEHARDLS